MAGEENDEQPLLPPDNQGETAAAVPWYRRRGILGAAIGTVVGAGVAVVAAPLVVAGLGFGAGGIVAGSYAASMMSAAAIANGGAVAAGSSVAILQSIGAAGFGLAGLLGVGAAGAGVGAAVGAGADVVMDGIQNNGDAGEGGGNSDAGSNGTGMSPMGQQPNAGEEGGGKENSGTNDVNIELAERQSNDTTAHSAMGKVELIITDSSDNSHSFTVTLDEPLQQVFTEFRGIRGLAPGTVRFELNGVQLDGDNTLRMIGWKIGDAVDAILL